jgi:hypothetical protein
MDLHEHSAGVRRLVHEFNNLLLVIGGHCELLTESCATEQGRADLAAVSDAVARAAVLTAELRAMALAVAPSAHAKP